MRAAARLALCLLLALAGAASWARPGVVDAAGRQVALPERVARTAVLGAVAPLNGFLFMLGRQETIGSGLPAFFQTPYWAMQRRLAPQLADLPVVAGSDGQPNVEALLALAPDVVLTSSRGALPVLETAGLPALYFEWKDFDDLRRTAELLGDVLGARARAAEFLRYCDGNIARVSAALAAGDAPRRPRVAFLRAKTFSQPARIADWTLAAAGGDNVGRYGVGAGQAAMTLEALLRADPETLIVWSREERDALFTDPRFAAMSAVRARRVHAVPVGATPWLAPGVEQCLGVLWTAQRLHPERFADLDLVEETRGFYRRFFSLPIDAGEAAAILDGMD
ncbi:MAG: ABC transporter substrate-binding protein [Rhodocyclaceae bacterium]|nr:ABC transporter substrate-binding protein [Rhodocyclaceae bacterium]